MAAVAVLVILVSGCSALPKTSTSVADAKPKTYLASIPIHKSEAFRNYLESDRTEYDKLEYLLGRIKEAKDRAFYYEGNRYEWTEAYAAGQWVIWRRYKKGEDARSFLKKQTYNTYIKPSNGSKELAFNVLMNELELIENRKTMPVSA